MNNGDQQSINQLIENAKIQIEVNRYVFLRNAKNKLIMAQALKNRIGRGRPH
jgi:hypothetical protein